jgi:hypothetical protein
MSALGLLALLALGDGAAITWREKELRLEALPEDLPPSARAALEAWHAWASGLEYRLDLDPAGRLLLVTRRSNDRAPALMELAGRVLERFDRELPAPAVRREVKPVEVAAKEPPKPVRKEPPLPEDPEDPEGEHPWKLAPPKPVQVTVAKPVIKTWGSHGQALDTQTVVVFVLKDQDDFENLLANLAERFPFLEVWTKEAKALMGFVLGDPLAGAYLETPDGVEEWDPDHELVNRLARLCLLRRFGELPNWFVQGYAWHHEIAEKGAIYCFPWRDEFVWATEHSGWHRIVKERFLKEKLAPADFMGWRRGKYLDAEAKASWGTCEFLVAKEAAKLPDLLDHLRVHREEHGRIQEDPNNWRRNTEYEIPVSEQQKLFVEHLGGDYMARATQFFRQELVQ